MSAGGGASMAGLAVTSASSATAAITTLDNAINRVNEIRGDLGAIQNRLEYTVNNLSSISNSTSASRGRILDADFAAETSALTKHRSSHRLQLACSPKQISRSKVSWLFFRANISDG